MYDIDCYIQISTVFGEHGRIVEIVLLKDKRTGLQQGMKQCLNVSLVFKCENTHCTWVNEVIIMPSWDSILLVDWNLKHIC